MEIKKRLLKLVLIDGNKSEKNLIFNKETRHFSVEIFLDTLKIEENIYFDIKLLEVNWIW